MKQPYFLAWSLNELVKIEFGSMWSKINYWFYDFLFQNQSKFFSWVNEQISWVPFHRKLHVPLFMYCTTTILRLKRIFLAKDIYFKIKISINKARVKDSLPQKIETRVGATIKFLLVKILSIRQKVHLQRRLKMWLKMIFPQF